MLDAEDCPLVGSHGSEFEAGLVAPVPPDAREPSVLPFRGWLRDQLLERRQDIGEHGDRRE